MHPSWVSRLSEWLHKGPCVLVTLRPIKGSAPRESGARMLVGEEDIWGSIGGGNLEFQAIEKARKILASARSGGQRPHPQDVADSRVTVGAAPHRDPVQVETVGLGPELNQCCGGWVELMFELVAPPAPDWLTKLDAAEKQGDPAVLATAVGGEADRHLVALPVGRESNLPAELRSPIRQLLGDASRTAIEVVNASSTDWWLQRLSETRRQIILFGAGHVGKALVRALTELPFQVRWLDARKDVFPESLPENVVVVPGDEFTAEIDAAPPKSLYIVMTHSHELDEDICHAILKREDVAFLGLIGSETKGRRFVHRLAQRGISEAALERLTCPIGLAGIRGKQPATIALGIAAQLMMEAHGQH